MAILIDHIQNIIQSDEVPSLILGLSGTVVTINGTAVSTSTFNTGTLVLQAVSAGYATTSSLAAYATTSSIATSAAYATTSSLAAYATTSSRAAYATTSSIASTATNAAFAYSFDTSTVVTTAVNVRGGSVLATTASFTGAINIASTSYINGSQILIAADLETVVTTATFITNDPTSQVGLATVANTTTVYGTYLFGNTATSVSTFNDYNTTTNTGFYSINDAATQPGYIVYVGWTNVTTFTRFVLNINYTASSGHTIDIDLYNFVTLTWDTFTTYSGTVGWFQFILEVIDPTAYISAGKVYARLYHVNTGNASLPHNTKIDYIALQDSLQGGQGPRGATGATGATGPQGVTTSTTSTFIFFNNSTTNSTITGAVTVVGGVGVGGDIYVGGNITVVGTINATVSGVITTATYATTSSRAAYATTASISAYATTSSIATSAAYATTSSIATSAAYATTASLASYATTSSIATSAAYATTSSIATSAAYATTASLASYATTSSIATSAAYATTASLASYATTSSIATTATSAAVAYSLASTSTTQVGFAVNAFTATSAAVAYSVASTSTLQVGSALFAVTATSAAVAYSLASTSTTQVGFAVNAFTATSAALAYSWTGGTVPNAVTFSGPVTFNGTATYVLSTNTVYTDNILEVHTTGTGVGGLWTYDDGKDIGFRFHYYGVGADQNAALVLANDTKYLEWYGTGAESNSGTFVGASYGTIKTGNISLTGVITATTFLGNLTGTASTATAAATAYALASTSTTQVGFAVNAFTATSAAIAYSVASTSSLQVGSAVNSVYAVTATNIAGGLTGWIHIQSTTGTTSFINIGSNGNILQSNGSTATFVSTSTLQVGFAVNAFTATSAATAYTLANTSTFQVGFAGNAYSATTATSAAVAYSIVNTSTTQVGFAVSAFTATSAAIAYSVASTSTLQVGSALFAVTATSAAVAYSIVNTSTLQVGFAVNAFTATSAATAYTLANTTTFLVGNALNAVNATNATNIAGGTAGLIPVQSAAGVTSFINTGTVGYVLQMQTGNTASWVSTSSLGISAGGAGLVSPYSGIFTITNTTNATSTVTGALQVAGGVGIGADLKVGGVRNSFTGTVIIGGDTNTFPSTPEVLLLNGTTDATNSSTGVLRVKGGASIAKQLWVSGALNAIGGVALGTTQTNTIYSVDGSDVIVVKNWSQLYTLMQVTAPTSTNVLTDLREATIALTRVDNSGNSEFLDVYNNGYLTGFPASQQHGLRSGAAGTGQLRPIVIDFTKGGVISTSTIFNTDTSVSIYSTLSSISATTGALKVTGGVGIGENLNVGGIVTATNMFIGPWAVSTGSSGTSFTGGTVPNATTVTNYFSVINSATSSARGVESIIGNADGTFNAPNNNGVMLHISGQVNQPGRLYIDGQGTGAYSAVIGRRYNGTTAVPTGLAANDIVFRLGGTPYTTNGWPSVSTTRIDYLANETQTTSTQGTRIEFWTTPNSGTTITKVMTIANTGTVIANTLTVSTLNVTTLIQGNLPLVLNDISNQFNGRKAVFALKTDQTAISGIVDSKNLEVVVDGRRLAPYVTEQRYPWFTPYDSYRGYRVVSTGTAAQFVVIYNAPDIGTQAVITQVNTSASKQTRKYPYSAATIALGD